MSDRLGEELDQLKLDLETFVRDACESGYINGECHNIAASDPDDPRTVREVLDRMEATRKEIVADQEERIRQAESFRSSTPPCGHAGRIPSRDRAAALNEYQRSR